MWRVDHLQLYHADERVHDYTDCILRADYTDFYSQIMNVLFCINFDGWESFMTREENRGVSARARLFSAFHLRLLLDVFILYILARVTLPYTHVPWRSLSVHHAVHLPHIPGINL